MVLANEMGMDKQKSETDTEKEKEMLESAKYSWIWWQIILTYPLHGKLSKPLTNACGVTLLMKREKKKRYIDYS